MSKITIFCRNFLNWRLIYPKIEIIAQKYAKGRLLDVGRGEKPFKKYFEPYCNFYVGLDINKNKLKRPYDLCGNAENTPFKNGNFHTIISFQTLEHIPNPFNFFQEVSRILKKVDA